LEVQLKVCVLQNKVHGKIKSLPPLPKMQYDLIVRARIMNIDGEML